MSAPAAVRGLGPADRLRIYDTRTSRCVFSAYTENPQPVDGPGGLGYDTAALLPVVHANVTRLAAAGDFDAAWVVWARALWDDRKAIQALAWERRVRAFGAERAVRDLVDSFKDAS